ncbi:MAG TPA: hypothetical protein VGH02_10990 [Rhizomicrobium sp.]|jgi:hypothetical protein
MDADLGRGESPNVGTRRVVLIIGGIMAVLVLVAFGFQAIFRDRIGQTYAVRHPFPTPAVIPDERAERLALEAQQKKDLAGAHDRLPIDAAMKAIAAKGDHAFDPIGGGP